MKNLQNILFLLLIICFGCKKMGEGVTPLGTFAEQISGFQGKVTMAATGQPVKDFIMRLHDGSPITTTWHSNGTFTTKATGYLQEKNTDADGNYKITELNRNLPIDYISFLGYSSIDTLNTDYVQQFIVDGVAYNENEYGQIDHFEFSKVKKFDIKLHEANTTTLLIDSTSIEAGEAVHFKGNRISPVSDQPTALNFIASLRHATVIGLNIISKPNVPITFQVQHIASDKKTVKSTRNITLNMNRKSETIRIF